MFHPLITIFFDKFLRSLGKTSNLHSKGMLEKKEELTSVFRDLVLSERDSRFASLTPGSEERAAGYWNAVDAGVW